MPVHPLRLALATSVVCLLASACTSVTGPGHRAAEVSRPGAALPAAQAPATTAGGDCLVAAPALDATMLQVRDVWPKTSSAAFGYQAHELHPDACSPELDLTAARPNCQLPFPWTIGDGKLRHALLAASGVTTVVTGMIRGHDPVADGKVISPQEIRETVLLRDGRRAEKSLVERFADICAKPYRVGGTTGYRTTVHSFDTGGEIVAFLLVTRTGLVWLEFDDGSWHEKDYAPVIRRAVARVAPA